MTNIFQAGEIVEIGIQIEKNGRDFYNTSATKSENQKARDIFIYLAGEEERHIAVFQKILNSLASFKPVESYPGEYFAYMNDLASKYIFTQKDKGTQIAKDTKDDREVIDLGIGFEKDSIVFYEGMKKAAPEHEHNIINQLILQEKDHLRQLSELKKDLFLIRGQ